MVDYNIKKVKCSVFHIFREEIKETKAGKLITHPELTCGLLQTCIIKAITFLLYFLRYFLPQHIRAE